MNQQQEKETLQNDLILRTLRGEETERVPVWIMRQAGRYLPEFRAVRSSHEFFKVCKTPSLCAEVTVQPLERFPLDAAIIFSDILVVPQVMGLEVQMQESVGPVFTDPVHTPDDLSRVNLDATVDGLNYVAEGIKETKKRLNGRVPLIGFAGAPWTVMTYMIEGKTSKEWTKAKTWLYRYPEDSHKLLSALTRITVQYLIMQARAGANLLQVFDSWVGILSPNQFKTFILPYYNIIANDLKSALGNDYPLIIFPKGAHYALEELSKTKFDAISIDWTLDPALARSLSGNKVLQGNLDPCALYGDDTTIRSEVSRMLDGFGRKGYIANLGHGLHPTHTPENVGLFVSLVGELSKKTV
eukprot:TRINITY_DN5167_c0_g4_i2.p1 TRINITY_DN5167_c0_g4~~TRINITY_DN5167_c0_g4_i2.p1  ORF type:complete len:356 (-),score=57.28 TRINITY_DN5167_c0_g4_i2:60-1127(-)